MSLYLEVLDASFSFDGAIGAFGITNDIVPHGALSDSNSALDRILLRCRPRTDRRGPGGPGCE